jgi:hypothetical protein
MSDEHRRPAPAPLGFIEPHAGLLQRPPAGQMLYKILSVENFIRSIEGGYLHFNRVDSYKDFPNADRHDGEQLPADRPGNVAATFAKMPEFSLADYYDRSRSRTYACCFSLDNSGYVWGYSSGTPRGNVGIAFDFDKLRATLNCGLQSGEAVLEYNGSPCRQILSINYGVVQYVDWEGYRANESHLPNPIIYTHLKDRGLFADENELRISLSASGVGKFVMADLTEIEFPRSLHLGFNFRAACADGTIQRILCGPNCDQGFLRAELHRLGAETCEG